MKGLAFCLAALLVLIPLATAAQAEVVIETVPVGNPGNANGTHGYGAVDYAYNLGKYEVTAGQYCEFLNAVAKTDTYGLYNTFMSSGPYRCGCKIQRSGSPGSYTYSVAGDYANRPVNYVSWGDAARFANWLHNGQPTGPQGLGTTEDGAYYLNGATRYVALMAVSRKADWKWAIPTENEWYKAAYHKNDGVTGNYFGYPTSSDSMPGHIGDGESITDPDPGNYATHNGDGGTDGIGPPYYRTEVGEHENSDSPYGTFDQGGNVWEWNEAIVSLLYRGLRSGSFIYYGDVLHASKRDYFHPDFEDRYIGFRVSEVHKPSGIPLLVIDGSTVSGCDRRGIWFKSRWLAWRFAARPGGIRRTHCGRCGERNLGRPATGTGSVRQQRCTTRRSCRNRAVRLSWRVQRSRSVACEFSEKGME